MKRFIYPMLLATAFVATACTTNQETDIVTPVDPNGKTAISFSVEEQNRALTRAGFTASTKIAMRIKSEATNQTPRYTRTVASAAAEESGKGYSSITVDGAYIRYWDDAHGRSSQLSVFAIAVPSKTDVTNDNQTLETKLTAGSDTWFTESTEDEKISWKVSTTQTGTTLANEDLTYSNNISQNGTGGVYQYNFSSGSYPTELTNLTNGRMQFRLQSSGVTDGPGKFDKGHLVFNHALSRITVNLKKGNGFTGYNSFKFATDTNVKILNVPVSGSLDLSSGAWTSSTSGNIDKMAEQTTATDATYTLMAQILPGYEISALSTTNMLSFTIDDNQYFITQKQMYDALKSASNMTKKDDTKVTMEQGLNYNFTVTVNKTNIINVTAVVESWSDVTAAEFTPSNARISLSGIYDSNSGTYSTGFDLYRVLDESSTITDSYDGKNWTGNYTDQATLTANSGDNSWSTNWYFDSNKAYYHFRTVNTGTTINGATNDTENSVADYFEISAGPVALTDPHWGAPMTKEPVYNVNDGYTDCLSSAIGATSDKINITDQHMMSNITVKLTTTNGNDKVTLAGSKVYITKLYTTGNVLMGTGLVTPTGNAAAQQEMTANSEGTEFTYAVVPQALVRAATSATDDDYVGITILTTDNQYYIIKKLSEITASTVSNVKSQAQGSAITRWFPGHTYTYNFTLKKTGIDKITCTVQGWINVTADNKNISLED